MFCDIKDQLDNLAIQRILSLCVYDSSEEGMRKKLDDYRNNDSRQFYGWIENGEVLGICGFEIKADRVEILNLAVAEKAQKHGIGRLVITALQGQYRKIIEVETDDSAVDFYRKCGFETTAFIHPRHNVRRWTGVLPFERSL